MTLDIISETWGGRVSITVMGTVHYDERITWEKTHNRYFRVWIINAPQKHCAILGLVASLWHYWGLVETVEGGIVGGN